MRHWWIWIALLTAGACGDGGSAARLQVERDTLGDTLVVRTLAGSVWEAPARLEPEIRIGAFEGEDVYMLGDVSSLAVADDGSIYLFDRQVPALRKYDADGTFVATLGREGGGPGEYKQPDGGLAVLPDSRVLLRDPGNARINVYGPDGAALDHWSLRGGYFTSRPLYVDTAGAAYVTIFGSHGGERYTALRRYSTTGELGDSILAPDWEFEPATISFSREGMSMTNWVPFSPTEQWSFSPYGYMVGSLTTRYAVDLFRPDGTVLRMERVVEPVPVQAGEAENAQARATANFKRAAPDWKWNGPPVPGTKPPIRGVIAGRDGRIYVHLSRPGEPIPADEIDEPTDPNATPPERWREPAVFDVFEDDGTYLGQIHAPERMSIYPQPIFDGDQVWAVTTDELGVEYLTRFRVVREAVDGD